jgi:hypothetical protein
MHAGHVQATAIAAQAQSMHVRCGVMEKFPLIAAVTNLIMGAINAVAGLLEEQEVSKVIEILISQARNPPASHVINCKRSLRAPSPPSSLFGFIPAVLSEGMLNQEECETVRMLLLCNTASSCCVELRKLWNAIIGCVFRNTSARCI